MPPFQNVTVYCSSSDELHDAHYQTARAVGTLLARSGRTIVFGGGRVGMMGHVARAARAAGGRTVGVITTRLRDAEKMDPDNHENLVVHTMRERKALLESRGEAFIILPGGPGTLEEFFEILVGRLLGEHPKPIHLLNPPDPDSREPDARFYDPLLEMMEHLERSRFARGAVRELFRVHMSPSELVAALDAHPAPEPAPA